jgi:DNA-binding LytR/AlgR family response regulator
MMSDIISKQPQTPKLRCLIVDDEENAIDGIRDYLNDMNSFQIVDTCLSALEAMEVLKEKEIDLMFLDINMPRLNGLEFLELLENPPLTILTTAYSEYALDGFRLHVVDYLLKPYTFRRFVQGTQKAVDMFKSRLLSGNGESEKTSDMYIRQGDAYQRIKWEEILFVEGMQNYLKLHFTDNVFVIHQTMVSLEEILPKDYFFRIHNSYLVNVKHIDKISGGRLFIHGKEIPVSKYRKEAFLNSIVYKNLISK